MNGQRIPWESHRLIIGLIVFVVCIGIFFVMNAQRGPHHVIVITGTSSSGKTSAAYVMQRRLGSDCSVVRLDDYIQKMIENKARELSWNEHMSVGPMDFIRDRREAAVGHGVFEYEIRANLLDYSPFYDAIRAAMEEHQYVIVDTIIESDRCRRELEAIVAGHRAFWVLLYCPLSVIEQRVLSRDNLGSFAHTDVSLATYESFLALYTQEKGEHWTAVDTLNAHEMRVLLDTSINAFLACVPYAHRMEYQDYTRLFRSRFLNSFGLDRVPHAAVPIYPAQRYDLVLNSAEHSEDALATKILHEGHVQSL